VPISDASARSDFSAVLASASKPEVSRKSLRHEIGQRACALASPESDAGKAGAHSSANRSHSIAIASLRFASKGSGVCFVLLLGELGAPLEFASVRVRNQVVLGAFWTLPRCK
jgi:hypothetical protein